MGFRCSRALQGAVSLLIFEKGVALKWETHVDGLCLVINGSLEVLGLVSVDELCFYAQTWEKDLELVVCASV